MGYSAFRDNPELEWIEHPQLAEIIMLADSLEYAGRQSYHNDACGCDPGRSKLSACKWRTGLGSTVYPDEILGMLYSRGLLILDGASKQ